ncbi:hypothetical protein RSC3_01882 [Bacillus paralicheniformis]|nr:hypothetical protein RSC3_01882 [Bacillus paralicheniformis]
MEKIQERSPADMIWDQIRIQYATIIRIQRIMFVQDKDDLAKELKKRKNPISPLKKSSKYNSPGIATRPS